MSLHIKISTGGIRNNSISIKDTTPDSESHHGFDGTEFVRDDYKLGLVSLHNKISCVEYKAKLDEEDAKAFISDRKTLNFCPSDFGFGNFQTTVYDLKVVYLQRESTEVAAISGNVIEVTDPDLNGKEFTQIKIGKKILRVKLIETVLGDNDRYKILDTYYDVYQNEEGLVEARFGFCYSLEILSINELLQSYKDGVVKFAGTVSSSCNSDCSIDEELNKLVKIDLILTSIIDGFNNCLSPEKDIEFLIEYIGSSRFCKTVRHYCGHGSKCGC